VKWYHTDDELQGNTIACSFCGITVRMYMVVLWKSMDLYDDGETALCGGFLGKVEQVRVALVADGHNTGHSSQFRQK
jgi:transcription elongation factor Elf1